MRDLDETLDYDEECLSSGARVSAECAARGRVIPAGEPHNRWEGTARDKDGEPIRRCVHCVRESSWETYKDKPLATRVSIEFSDGTVAELEGEAAIDWARQVSGILVVHALRGGAQKAAPWKVRQK